jgi:hypothetical protein
MCWVIWKSGTPGQEGAAGGELREEVDEVVIKLAGAKACSVGGDRVGRNAA